MSMIVMPESGPDWAMGQILRCARDLSGDTAEREPTATREVSGQDMRRTRIIDVFCYVKLRRLSATRCMLRNCRTISGHTRLSPID